MKLCHGIAFFLLLMPLPAWAQTRLPDPQIVITSTETYTINGQDFRRYRFDVTNKALYPAALFAPAPNLPPCGANANSSRTWVDFFEGASASTGTELGRRLYGFCALNSPAALDQIWFALPVAQVPPASVAIVLTDRATNTRYRSNAVSLTAEALMVRAEALPSDNWREAFSLADVALQIRFPGTAPIERSWFNRYRRFGVRGASTNSVSR
jgi:hypothetical protein